MKAAHALLVILSTCCFLFTASANAQDNTTDTDSAAVTTRTGTTGNDARKNRRTRRGSARQGRRGAHNTKTSQTAELSASSRLRPAPPPKKAPAGRVLRTEAGGLGGATSYTQNMPLDRESLIAMRRPFINRPEFRAAWITRFDWTVRKDGKFDAEATKARIIELLDAAKDMHLNAVMFQVRGDATVLYPSKYEPFSQLMDGKDPGFDALEMAVREAHKRGLELHAYMNPVPCSEEKTTEPANPNHVYYKHCMPDSQPNWLVFKDGKPAPFNEYKWFNPNLPEVQTYIRTVLLDAISRYDIDGVHFDRIRFPGPEVSDDPWSRQRFEGDGNPDHLNYSDWEADNITRMLTDVYGLIAEVKPKVKVSASVWGIYDHSKLPQGTDKATGYSWTSTGLQDYHQDSIGWINRGCMDALVPMIYWNMGDLKPDYDELLLQFMTGIHNGRHVYGGERAFNGDEMVRQVVATNITGAQGNVLFTLNRMRSLGDVYPKLIYPNHVPTPEMYWKTKPVYGHVLVTVKDSDGKPVTDAHVTVSGKKYTALSSADGFCAILDVLPGSAVVHAEKGDLHSADKDTNVNVGKVSRVELRLE